MENSIRLEVELKSIDNKLDMLAENIEACLRRLERKPTIDYGRPSDFGQRFFTMQIILDDFNLEDLDEVVKTLKTLITDFRNHRAKQDRLRRELGMETAHQRDLKMDFLNVTIGRQGK